MKEWAVHKTNCRGSFCVRTKPYFRSLDVNLASVRNAPLLRPKYVGMSLLDVGIIFSVPSILGKQEDRSGLILLWILGRFMEDAQRCRCVWYSTYIWGGGGYGVGRGQGTHKGSSFDTTIANLGEDIAQVAFTTGIGWVGKDLWVARGTGGSGEP